MPLAALPFIIHLIGERRHRHFEFSSLKFLREIEHDSLKKLRWRQWLILLLRALAILLLILALARPLYRGAAGSPDAGMLLIDRSFSTDSDPAFSPKAAAYEEAFENWTLMDYDEKSSTDSLRAAIRKNMELYKLRRPQLLLISDFQNNKQNREIINMLSGLPLEPRYLPIGKEEVNFAVSGLSLLPEVSVDDLLSLEVESSGNPEAVRVRINGHIAGRVDTRNSNSGIFRFDPGDAEYVRCSAQCGDDSYPGDNTRYAVLRPYRQFHILDISSRQPSGYHQTALRAMRGAELKSIDPQFLAAEDIDDYDILILDAFTELPDAQRRRILDYSEKNPLLLIAGPHGDGQAELFGSGRELQLRSLGGDFAMMNNPYDAVDPFRIHRYYKSGADSAEVIWRLNNGDPLLVRLEKRRFMLLSPFIFDWNEMGLSPYFTRMLTGFIQKALQLEPLAYETGDTLSLDRPLYTVRTPGGELHQMRGPFTETDVPGFYVLEASGIYREIAVNVPAEECIQEVLEPQYPDTLLSSDSDPAALAKMLRGRDAQSLFLILAAVCLLAEMLLAGKGEQSFLWKK